MLDQVSILIIESSIYHGITWSWNWYRGSGLYTHYYLKLRGAAYLSDSMLGIQSVVLSAMSAFATQALGLMFDNCFMLYRKWSSPLCYAGSYVYSALKLFVQKYRYIISTIYLPFVQIDRFNSFKNNYQQTETNQKVEIISLKSKNLLKR